MELHKKYPSVLTFGKLIAAINDRVKPHLHIVDAITGMHRDGPSSGEPFSFGFLAASPKPPNEKRHGRHINIPMRPYGKGRMKSAIQRS